MSDYALHQYTEVLHAAAAEGDVDRITEALKATSDVDVRNNKGWTALMFAARNGHLEAVKTLIGKGCDINKMNSVGQTSRDIAEFWQHRELATFLSDQSTSSNSFTSSNHEVVHNYLCDNPLNRMSEARTNEAWMNAVKTSPRAVYVLFTDLQPYGISTDRSPAYSLIRFSHDDTIKSLTDAGATVIFLGVENEDTPDVTGSSENVIGWFALDATTLSSERMEEWRPDAKKISIPLGLLQLSRSEAAITGQGRAMLAWHSRYLFCPTCGAGTVIKDAGYKRECTKKDCASNKGVHNTCYPRTDPTVIMAVVSPDKKKVLLGRKAMFPSNMWSCLAGFMEPGEGIEEACRREVYEESRIKVGHVEYHSSQPWPLPSSLMIGCIGYAESTAITVDKGELEDVRWFTGQEIRQMLTHQHPQRLFCPPDAAIAHQLIKHCATYISKL